ncbi:hypothetical protein Prudu_014632 [Prunus dulcis]|uniref:Uncharacterized protein n=1 Tax=Prunus dulcis TaxID=3755 RepID=A0A4Y1RHB5_PRUDU|nr:hypothetical protein Prudu_014632 [Prunus dulcis]
MSTEERCLLVLKGLDSKLSKSLPPDLQKLRCKHRAKKMWIEGPYIALHLWLEKDVWVRTGCLTGFGSEYDDIITKIRFLKALGAPRGAWIYSAGGEAFGE